MSLEISEVITPGNESSFQVGSRKPGATLADLPDVHRALLEDDAEVTASLATVRA